jgi:diguanylate cyclase (GGDEF)-like protein
MEKIAAKKKHRTQLSKHRATSDALTGLYNREQLRTFAKHQVEQSLRYDHPLSVILLDVDFLKRINKANGRQVGDQVLAEIARRISELVRTPDIVARYGEEEFGILLPETHRADAEDVANRLCTDIATKPISTERGEISVTVSLGVATLPESGNVTFEEILSRAERALYLAKQEGRNRVIMWAA